MAFLKYLGIFTTIATSYFCLCGETSKFFIKYKKHSKDIVKTLKDGYGNQQILGSVDVFDIIYPKEPEIEDIGIAKKHLEKDYPELWKLKNSVMEISRDRLNLINTIINRNFPSRIRELLKGTDSSILFYEDVYIEIFSEIQNNMNNESRRLLPRVNGDTTILYAYYEPDKHKILLVHNIFILEENLRYLKELLIH